MLHGVAVTPSVPRISHLLLPMIHFCFVMLLLVFALEISSLLHHYSLASRQIINLEKSTVVFSRNTGGERVEEVRVCLPARVVDKHEKYLGLPIEMGRFKREVFSWLRERVWSKIRSFGNNFLSKAGKEVLIKSVIQAIPTYVMWLVLNFLTTFFVKLSPLFLIFGGVMVRVIRSIGPSGTLFVIARGMDAWGLETFRLLIWLCWGSRCGGLLSFLILSLVEF